MFIQVRAALDLIPLETGDCEKFELDFILGHRMSLFRINEGIVRLLSRDHSGPLVCIYIRISNVNPLQAWRNSFVLAPRPVNSRENPNNLRILAGCPCIDGRLAPTRDSPKIP